MCYVSVLAIDYFVVFLVIIFSDRSRFPMLFYFCKLKDLFRSTRKMENYQPARKKSCYSCPLVGASALMEAT